MDRDTDRQLREMKLRVRKLEEIVSELCAALARLDEAKADRPVLTVGTGAPVR